MDEDSQQGVEPVAAAGQQPEQPGEAQPASQEVGAGPTPPYLSPLASALESPPGSYPLPAPGAQLPYSGAPAPAPGYPPAYPSYPAAPYPPPGYPGQAGPPPQNLQNFAPPGYPPPPDYGWPAAPIIPYAYGPVPPSGWTPGSQQSRSRTLRLFVWLAQLIGAFITVTVSFLVLWLLSSWLLAAADPSYRYDVVGYELVWLIPCGGACFISSFLGGLVARGRNRAEAAGLLGCVSVVTIVELSRQQSSGTSTIVKIPSLLALLDYFLPLCLILIGAAVGVWVARRIAS